MNFFRIDDASVNALRSFRPIVEEKFSSIIDNFYDHISAFQDIRPSKFRLTDLEKLKAAQKDHWMKIFRAEFNEEYKREVQRIGRLHHIYGIGPSWLLGGYAYIGSELLRLAHRENSGFLGVRAHSGDSLERALMQVVLLNSQIILSVYFRSNAHNRVRTICSMVDQMEHEAATSLDDMGELTKGVADTAAVLFGFAQESSERACIASTAAEQVVAGSQVIATATEQLHESIDEINRQVSESKLLSAEAKVAAVASKKTAAALSKVVEQIYSFIDVISKIAHQTNMLALNASIEAARHGEAGRGFGIVANEVRELATRTSDATSQISQEIAAVREHTHQSVAVIDNSVSILTKLEAASALISSAVEEQSFIAKDIAGCVEENALSACQVSEVIEDMKRKALETRNLSEDLSKDGKRIDGSIESLRIGLTRVARSANEADRRELIRHSVLFDVRIASEGETADGELNNLSEDGCTIVSDTFACQLGREVSVECHGETMQGIVVACDGETAHLRFPLPMDHDRVGVLSIEGAKRLIGRAVKDHTKFMETIYDTIEGRDRKKAADLADHHTCRLGHWYDSVSDDRLRNCPSFSALAGPHHRVHVFGKKALAAISHQDMEAAETAAREARKASYEVVRLLENLDRELAASLTDEGDPCSNVVRLRSAN